MGQGQFLLDQDINVRTSRIQKAQAAQPRTCTLPWLRNEPLVVYASEAAGVISLQVIRNPSTFCQGLKSDPRDSSSCFLMKHTEHNHSKHMKLRLH